MEPNALVAELAKKSGLLWVRRAGGERPVWHEWVGDAACVVVDGGEQPLPGITDGDDVTLLLRSKTNRALVAEVAARAELVPPGSEHWESVTTALKAGRLNLADPDTAIERWASTSRVLRFVPTGAPRLADTLDTALPATSPRLARPTLP